MKKSVYLKLQLKRAFRHYPSVLLVTFVAIFGIVVTLGTLFFINNNSRDKQRINIGIVGNLHESRIDVVLYALENMDNLVTSVKFVELSQEEADKAIKMVTLLVTYTFTISILRIWPMVKILPQSM